MKGGKLRSTNPGLIPMPQRYFRSNLAAREDFQRGLLNEIYQNLKPKPLLSLPRRIMQMKSQPENIFLPWSIQPNALGDICYRVEHRDEASGTVESIVINDNAIWRAAVFVAYQGDKNIAKSVSDISGRQELLKVINNLQTAFSQMQWNFLTRPRYMN